MPTPAPRRTTRSTGRTSCVDSASALDIWDSASLTFNRRGHRGNSFLGDGLREERRTSVQNRMLNPLLESRSNVADRRALSWIRSLGHPLDSVSYTYHIAGNARNASVAVEPCL